jgi:hypothetical protein
MEQALEVAQLKQLPEQPSPSKTRRSGTTGVLALVPLDEQDHYDATVFAARAGQVRPLLALGTVGPRTDVRALLSRTKVRLPREVVTALMMPRHHLIVKQVRVPTHNSAEAASMAKFEAHLHAPWPPAECLVGHELVVDGDDGHGTLVLYIAHQPRVEARLDALARMGLQVTQVVPSSQALALLLRCMLSAEGTALFCVYGSGLEYLRLEGGGTAFSRGTSAADALPEEMLRQSLELDARRMGGRCEELITVGLSLERAEQSLELAGVRALVRPIKDLPITVLAGQGPLQSEAVPAFATALAALDPLQTSNLLPPRHQRTIHLRQTRRLAAGASALVVLFAATAATGGLMYRQVQLQRIADARAKIAALGPDAGALRMMKDSLDLLTRERLQVSLPMRTVLDLYARTPAQIALNSFRYDAKGALVLGGEAASYADVFQYLQALAESPLIGNVQLTSSAKSRMLDQTLVEFKLTCRLSSAPAGGGG